LSRRWEGLSLRHSWLQIYINIVFAGRDCRRDRVRRGRPRREGIAHP